MTTYLVVVGVVLGVNLLPAFGPPTWAVLVLFYLRNDLSEVALVLTGAGAAAAGRLTLAHTVRRLRQHLPARQRDNLNAAGSLLLRRRSGSIVALVLFVLSPIPSAQLFEAAGLMRIPLGRLTAAFFAGRLVSYSLYLGGAHAFRRTSAADLMMSTLTSPYGVLLEIVLITCLVALAQIDWGHLRIPYGTRDFRLCHRPSGRSTLKVSPRPVTTGEPEENLMKLSVHTHNRHTAAPRVRVHTQSAPAVPSTTRARDYLLAGLRLCMGWVFLWAFLDKMFGLGHDTTSKQAWINGGSPTYGFLHFSATGPFAGFYRDIAGQGWADWLFMLGLLGIGIGLCAGIAMRVSVVAAAIMLVLMWSVVLPPANNPFMDDHLIYAIAVLALPLLHADRTLGLGRWWAQTSVVRRFPILS